MSQKGCIAARFVEAVAVVSTCYFYLVDPSLLL